MQHTFGYARVSATDQNLDTQVEDLTRAGCSRIFQDRTYAVVAPSSAWRAVCAVQVSFNRRKAKPTTIQAELGATTA
ncbi:MAG: recombinase family protein [Janthinobacterium lividum]